MLALAFRARLSGSWRGYAALVCGLNRDDRDLAARSPDKPFYVVRVTRENHRFLANRYGHHNGVNDIRGSGLPEQPSCFVRLAFAERNDRAPGQEAPELGLLRRPADLGENRRRNRRNSAEFQTRLVLCPCPPTVPIGRHENGCVVDNAAHAGRRTVRDVLSCAATVRRASSISSALKGPCCFSHSATAAKPALRCNTWRAALVIQAETLTPSRTAATRIFS